MLFSLKDSVLIVALGLIMSACASTQTPSPIESKIAWTYLGETHWGEIKHYVNLSSIKKNGVLAQVESRNVLKSPETTSFLNGKKYAYDINQWEINCQSGKIKLLSANYYNAERHLIFRHAIQKPSVNSIPENSILGSLYQLICRNQGSNYKKQK